MKIPTIAILALAAATLAYADSRGLKVVGVRTSDGQEISLYENSHALLVGVSDYQAGWPRLPSVPKELSDVEAALKAGGFSTTKILDPDHAVLERGFREFIRAHGYDPGNRLLFYFAGHGWSRRGGEQGYLVPVNAPDPTKDERGFLRKALTMTQILAWCKEIDARHALFLFDSCFSGTIFTTRSLPDHPPHISPLIAKPVRQFITAGDAGEEVPATSVFTPLFIRAIQGEADLTGDGYVTGTELGLFLRDKVMYYQTGQTPQYGKIRDPGLDQGDFVFAVVPQQEAARPDEQSAATRSSPRVRLLGTYTTPPRSVIFKGVSKNSPDRFVIETPDGSTGWPGLNGTVPFCSDRETDFVVVNYRQKRLSSSAASTDDVPELTISNGRQNIVLVRGVLTQVLPEITIGIVQDLESGECHHVSSGEAFTSGGVNYAVLSVNTNALSFRCANTQRTHSLTVANRHSVPATSPEIAGRPSAEPHIPSPSHIYEFNDSPADALGKGQNFRLTRTSYWENRALFLSGEYGRDEGYTASVAVPDLDYLGFTVDIRFYSLQFDAERPKTTCNILCGGESYRWFSLRCSKSSRLEITFNNQDYAYEFPIMLHTARWHRLICSVDLLRKQIFVSLDGQLQPRVDLPDNFALRVMGSPRDKSDREFTFTNYSNSDVFHGYIDWLRIFSESLSGEQISMMDSRGNSR